MTKQISVVWLALVVLGVSATEAQERPPVFRAGAHYVKVDAYPLSFDMALLAQAAGRATRLVCRLSEHSETKSNASHAGKDDFNAIDPETIRDAHTSWSP